MRYFFQILIAIGLCLGILIAPNTSSAQLIKSEQSTDPDSSLELAPLRLAGIPILVEIADTPRSRQRGLMHRHFMAEHRGMLFVFSKSQELCFWMRNTSIPLSIAYIDENAKVIDMFDMQPLDERSICSTAPALFALEVNQGWFERHNIKTGDQLEAGKWQDTEKSEKMLQKNQNKQ